MVELSDTVPKLRIALIGASGAIGREVAECVMQDNRVSEVILLCRRVLPEWQQQNFLPKLTILLMADFDSLPAFKS